MPTPYNSYGQPLSPKEQDRLVADRLASKGLVAVGQEDIQNVKKIAAETRSIAVRMSRKKRILTGTIALIATLIAVQVCLIGAAIWEGDWRWFWTSLLLVVPDVAAGVGGTILFEDAS